MTRSWRRPSPARPIGRSSVVSLVVGLVVVAVGLPTVAGRLPDLLDHEQASTLADPAPEVATAAPATGPAELVVQVVPAVRDVGLVVDGTLVTSDAAGVIRTRVSGPRPSVTFQGYSVLPALLEVGIATWSDGTEDPERTVDASAPGTDLELGIEVRYRVVVETSGPSSAAIDLLTGATSTTVPLDEPTWLLARRATEVGGTLRAEDVTYRAVVDGRPTGQVLAPRPEGVIVVDV